MRGDPYVGLDCRARRVPFVSLKRIGFVLRQQLSHDDANSPKKDKLPLLHQQFVFQAIHQSCAQWSSYQYCHHRCG